MGEKLCPLVFDADGEMCACREGCAWLVPDGDGVDCAAAVIARATRRVGGCANSISNDIHNGQRHYGR